MRESAVKVLGTKLYGDTEHIGQLQIFTKKFSQRILEIAESDSDISVQIQGVNLVTEMSRYSSLLLFIVILFLFLVIIRFCSCFVLFVLIALFRRSDLIKDKEKERIYKLVGSNNAKLREAVGVFIYENVLRDADDKIAKLTGKAAKKGSAKLLDIQKQQLSTLVDFILEYHPIPDMPYYVVDSLWKHCTLLKVFIIITFILNLC